MLKTPFCRSFSTSLLKKNFLNEIPLPKQPPIVALSPKLVNIKCDHGASITCLDNMGPTSTLIFRLPCGSRFENNKNSGVAHYLKNFLFSYTSNQSPIQIAREMDLRGVQLHVALDREFLDFRAKFERNDLEFVVGLISDVVQNTRFNHWELELAKLKVREEANLVWNDASEAGIQLAHQLAFRDGLGHPTVALYSNQVKKDDVFAFAHSHLGLSSAAQWVGVGVDGEALKHLCESHFKSTLDASTFMKQLTPSRFQGGQSSRFDLPGPSNITLAFSAPSLSNSKQIASFMALKSLIQSTPSVKWGNKVFPLTKGSVSAFFYPYSDAGLFGLTSTHSDPDICTQTIQMCLDTLKTIMNGKVSSTEVKKAMFQAKFETVQDTQLGQALQLASHQSKLFEAFDQLKETDVIKTMEQVLKSKPVLAVCGKTQGLPYLDTFKF